MSEKVEGVVFERVVRRRTVAVSPTKHDTVYRFCVVVFLIKILLYTLIIIIILSLSGNSGSLTWVRLQQPQEQRYPVLQVYAGSFRVSVIHRTPTWTTGSLTCVRDHSHTCVYTRGLGTQTACHHNIFDSEKLSQFFRLCS